MSLEKNPLIFYVNGKKIIDYDVDPEDNLLTYLRKKLLLTGCKYGCGEGACGACTVMVSHYDRQYQKIENFAVTSCLFPICSAHGKAITTVEGIGSAKKPHPVQERLAKCHGSQCGFCSPGMVMSMYAALRNNPKISYEDIVKALHGNLCRCTGYRPILAGFRSFAEECGKECSDSNKECPCKQTEDSIGTELTKKSEFISYNPNQDPIFPPELQLSNELSSKTVCFSGPRVTWISPASLKELLYLKEKYPSAPIMFGNTFLRVSKQNLTPPHGLVIAPLYLSELHERKVENGYLNVGAAYTVTQLQNIILETSKNISETAKQGLMEINKHLNLFGGQQIRNMVALGSNIVAHFAASDVNVLLVGVGAVASILSQNGTRNESVWNLITDSNKKVQSNEILTVIRIPLLQENEYFVSFKQTMRTYSDSPIVNVATKINFLPKSDEVENAIVAYGNVGQNTILATNTMAFLQKKHWDKIDQNELLKKVEKDLDQYGDKSTMNEYKKTLAISLMFKIYISVSNQLKNTVSLHNLPKPGDLSAIESTDYNFLSHYTFPKADDNPSINDTITHPVMHASALEQTTGEAIYCEDLPSVNGQLYMGLVISERAHAIIDSVDPSPALALNGVVSYIDHRDVVDNKLGFFAEDETVFAAEKVLYKGHLIGVVLAEDQMLARRAAKLVKVKYTDLKPIFTVEDAIKENSYLLPKSELNKGNIKCGLAESDIVIEGEVSVGRQKHLYIEPIAVTAIPRKEHDELEIFITTQDIATTQRAVAKALGIPTNRIDVKVKRVGGSYGGKISQNNIVGIPAAVAAYTVKRPVRCYMTREEDMVMVGTRCPALFKYKVGVMKNGQLNALDVKFYLNSGYSIDFKPFIIAFITTRLGGPYRIPHVHVECYPMKTNLPTATALRGFGTPQALFFIENVMNALALKLNISPEKIREINFLKSGEATIHNQIIDPNPIPDCWNECLNRSDYFERKNKIQQFNKANKWKKRGLFAQALMFGIENNHFPINSAGVLLNINSDGSVLVTSGGIEIGQGLHTRLIQIASKELDIPVSKIHIVETATSKVPNGRMTAGSGSTDSFGWALVDACEIMNKRLMPIKKEKPQATWEELISQAYLNRVNLSTTGFWKNPKPSFHADNYEGDFSDYYAFGAISCEVEVDCLTGGHKFLACHMVVDMGKNINPAIDIGQLEGAFIMGCGYFTSESWSHDKTGEVLARGPRTYRIPTVGDIPEQFHLHIMKGTKNPRGIYSSRAIGEMSVAFGCCLFLAIKEAIKAARADAGIDGDFTLDCPCTVDKIRMACTDHLCFEKCVTHF